jgi:hypothetical protein
MNRFLTAIAASATVLASLGCQFTPTAPFSGFDSKGTRLVGRFDAGPGGGVQNAVIGANATAASVQGIVVLLSERPEFAVTVDQNGTFTLSGLPAGSFTLVFQRDGATIGEVRFSSVRKNQKITIIVLMTSEDEVVLVDEQRDQVSFAGECPRGAGFWCQNKNGNNPNLSAAEFQTFAQGAATLLTGVAALDTAEEIAAAVCNTSNQFLRQLATLSLNLASNTVTSGTSLTAEQSPYLTVGAVFEAAVAHLKGTATLSAAAQQALKDVMDRINNAQNVAGCNQLPDDDVEPPPSETPGAGQVTICHIPPGNYSKRKTITIGASAWPAHQKHCAQGTCDSLGGCS